MGIQTELAAVPSLTLGTVDVTPIEMAAAYQTLANDGKHCESFAVAKVVDDDGVFYRHKPVCKQVVTPEIAHLVTAMMQGGVSHGTGTAAALYPWAVAGKTGTTQDYSNAWFVGYTRQVSTAVWVGFPGTPDSLALYFGQSVFGGTLAAPIWHDYMARIMVGMPAVGFPSPPAPEVGAVPDVVGFKSEHAQNVLAAANFTPNAEIVDSALPKGTVVTQTPAGGTSARARGARDDRGQQRRAGEGEGPRRGRDVGRGGDGGTGSGRLRRRHRRTARERSRQRRARLGAGSGRGDEGASGDDGHDHGRTEGRPVADTEVRRPSPSPEP